AQTDLGHGANGNGVTIVVEDADLLVRQGAATGCEPLGGHRIIRRGEPDEAAQFALAVALAQRALELVPPRHLELRGYRASARQAEPQRDRWPPAPGTLVEHVPESRRVGGHHGGPHSLGRLPTRLCGPAGHHARGPAGMKDWKKVRYELIGARQGRRSEAHVL